MKTPLKPVTVKHSPVKERVSMKLSSYSRFCQFQPIVSWTVDLYISGGVVFAKDPVSGRQNLSFHRMQVKGPKKLGIDVDPWRHLKDFLANAHGQPLDIAICIGLPPAVEIGGAVRVPYDEIEMAGALVGEPIDVVQCDHVNIQVPACTEILIEGSITPTIEMEDR